MRDELNPYARLMDMVPEGCTPVGFVAAIEFLDEDGDYMLAFSESDGTPVWKAIGMAEMLSASLRERTRVQVFEDGDDD